MMSAPENGQEPPAPNGDNRAPRPLWREHLSLLVTAVVFSLFVLKVVAVSHLDTTTAAALLRVTGPAPVLFSIATNSGVAFGLGFLLSVISVVVPADDPKKTPLTAGVFIILSLTLVLILSPLLLALIYLVGLGVAVWLATRKARGKAKPKNGDARYTSDVRTAVFIGGFLAAVLLTVRNEDAWLPLERIQTNAATHVGYVLEENERWTVMLHDGNRTVERLATSSVRRRTYCRRANRSWLELSLYSISRPTTYPKCGQESRPKPPPRPTSPPTT